MKSLIPVIIASVISSVISCQYMKKKGQKIVDQLIDEMNLRSDLLNWVSKEGVFMPAEDFWPLYNEKARFINIVTINSDR